MKFFSMSIWTFTEETPPKAMVQFPPQVFPKFPPFDFVGRGSQYCGAWNNPPVKVDLGALSKTF